MNSSLSTFPSLAFLVGPWLLFGLLLSGPFVLVLMVLVVAVVLPIVPLLVVAAVLVARRSRRQSVEAFELRPVTA